MRRASRGACLGVKRPEPWGLRREILKRLPSRLTDERDEGLQQSVQTVVAKKCWQDGDEQVRERDRRALLVEIDTMLAG